MSVKHAILGLLYMKPRHGYEIKTEFEQMVRKLWPLNTGQIYTTLERLVRDKFVEPLDGEDRDRKQYAITEQGKGELLDWLRQPVERSLFKDEFYFKLLCAKRIDFPDLRAIINGQKAIAMQTILEMTRIKASLVGAGEAAMLLLLEGSLLHLEADLQWLELAERVLAEQN